MKPVPFAQANRVLRAPPGVSREECGDLHVHNTDGVSTSVWELDAADLAALELGGKVYLQVWGGDSQPPVALLTESPFEE